MDLSRIPVNKGTNARLGWTKYNICMGNSMICSDIWHKYHE